MVHENEGLLAESRKYEELQKMQTIVWTTLDVNMVNSSVLSEGWTRKESEKFKSVRTSTFKTCNYWSRTQKLFRKKAIKLSSYSNWKNSLH